MATFTIKVTHLQESSPMAPDFSLPHLSWPFTHAQIVREGKMPQPAKAVPAQLHPVFNKGLGLRGFV